MGSSPFAFVHIPFDITPFHLRSMLFSSKGYAPIQQPGTFYLRHQAFDKWRADEPSPFLLTDLDASQFLCCSKRQRRERRFPVRAGLMHRAAIIIGVLRSPLTARMYEVLHTKDVMAVTKMAFPELAKRGSVHLPQPAAVSRPRDRAGVINLPLGAPLICARLRSAFL